MTANIYLSAGNRVHLDNTKSTASNATSLQIEGGTYIKKDLYIGGDLDIADSTKVLDDDTILKTEEVVVDNPMLLIGQHNTDDTNLSGFINRYQDDNNDYKFTGLVRHNSGSKPYVLIKDVESDTNDNSDVDSTNLSNVVTNTNNSKKDNYSNVTIDKLKSLSTNENNNETDGIYTKGSLSVSKNIYVGDINHKDGNIQLGSHTNINYEKIDNSGNNNGKFIISTNVDLDLFSTNSKNTSLISNSNLEYQVNKNLTSNITSNLTETITNNLTKTIKNSNTETYNKNLNRETKIANSTYNLPFSFNINSTSRTDIHSNKTKDIVGTNTFIITNSIDETLNKDSNITIEGSEDIIIKDNKELTISKNIENTYGNSNSVIDKTHTIKVDSTNNESHINLNKTIINDSHKTVGGNHDFRITTNSILYSDNNTSTYEKNSSDISNFLTNNISLNNESFLNKTNDLEIGGECSETYNKMNDIKVSNNFTKIINNSSNETYLDKTDTYKKQKISLTDKNITDEIKNEYKFVLNQDLNETYGNNQAYNVNENILINYNNNLTETFGSYTSILDRSEYKTTTTTFTVSLSQGKFSINGVSQNSLQIYELNTYIFNLSDEILDTHPFLLSITNDGTHNSGSVYSTNVVYKINGASVSLNDYIAQYSGATTRTLEITPDTTLVLYYYNHYFPGLGSTINILESLSITNKINITNNRNITSGNNSTNDTDSLVVQTNLNKLLLSNSTEIYNKNLNDVSFTYDLNLKDQYNMICNSSTNHFKNNYVIKCENNLNETISNSTISYRQIGGNGSVVTYYDCVVRIHEGNNINNKKPTEYIPGDTIGSVTLKQGDLILFDYTSGNQTFNINSQTTNNISVDYASLNGIYNVNA